MKKSNQLLKEVAKLSIGDIYSFLNLLVNQDPVIASKGSEEVYQTVLADPHTYGLIQSRKSGVMSYEYDIEKANAKANVTKEVKAFLDNLDVKRLISEILETPYYGFSVFEIYWELRDLKYYPVKIVSKPRRWFGFNQDKNLVFKTDKGDFVDCPEEKFLLVQHEASYDNPFGVSILSKCFWNVYFKRNAKNFWAIFTEKYGMPWVKASYERNVKKEAIENYYNETIEMIQDGVILLPTDMNLEIVTTGGTSSSDIFLKLITDSRLENSILILGHSGASESTPGKLGGEDNALSATARIIESDRKMVEDAINDLIYKFCKLNYGDIPTPEFHFFEEEDIHKERADRDQILRNSGVIFTKEYYMKHYNLDEDDFELDNDPNQEEEVDDIEKPDSTAEPVLQEEEDKVEVDVKKFDAKAVNIQVFAQDEPLALDFKDQTTIDEFNDFLETDKLNEALFKAVLSSMKKFVGERSMSDVFKNYADLFKTVNLQKLTKRLEMASFLAHLHGYNSSNILKQGKSQGANADGDEDTELDAETLIKLIEYKPEAAIEYIKKMGVKTSKDWKETYKLIQQHIFTVTNVAKLDIVLDFKELIEKSIESGLSNYEFKKELNEKLKSKGWIPKENGMTAHRLNTIYRTNVQNAYQDGKWKEMEEASEDFPYVRQISTLDPSTTGTCSQLNGKVFKVTDSYYSQHLRPPGHFNCRRTVISMTKAMVTRRGLKIEDGASNANLRNAKGFDNKGSAWSPDLSKYPKELKEQYEEATGE
jgi:SPP1 gp7 family putative phage head morphogenesis protein